jgi:hypothetical protein
MANREPALALVSEKTYRIWVLYLVASSRYFAEGSIGLYQTVLHRSERAAVSVPTTRESIYTPATDRSRIRA